MKYDLISDFHVEHNNLYGDSRFRKEGEPWIYAWHVDRKSPILVVGGDVSNKAEDTSTILSEAAEYYEHVIFVDGNHDNYGCTKWIEFTKDDKGRSVGYFKDVSTVPAEMDKLAVFADSLPNVTYLNGINSIVIDGCLFIGANGWYNFAVPTDVHMSERVGAWRTNTNDPDCLNWGNGYRSDKPDGPKSFAFGHASLLRNHVIEAQENDEIKEIIITTHVPPTDRVLISPEHPKLGHLAKSNGSYYNSHMPGVVAADVKGKIKVWNFGHTHFPHDIVVDGVRYVCNPRGYHGERWRRQGGFKGVLQIDTEYAESAFGEVER